MCCGLSPSVLTAEILGQRIRAAREGASLTQGDLERITGLDQTTLSRVESGRDISSLVLAKIAQATGRDINFFLSDPEPESAVMLRAADAESPEAKAAVEWLTRFVGDYEFLLELTPD